MIDGECSFAFRKGRHVAVTTVYIGAGEAETHRLIEQQQLTTRATGGRKKMQDWAPVFISFLLFILLSPGLLFQMPAKSRLISFGNFQTSVASILVHTIIFFAIDAVFLVAIGVHIQFGSS